MQASLNHVQLESLLRELDSTAPDCREKIATMRRMMDEACDKRSITLSQWRFALAGFEPRPRSRERPSKRPLRQTATTNGFIGIAAKSTYMIVWVGIARSERTPRRTHIWMRRRQNQTAPPQASQDTRHESLNSVSYLNHIR